MVQPRRRGLVKLSRYGDTPHRCPDFSSTYGVTWSADISNHRCSEPLESTHPRILVHGRSDAHSVLYGLDQRPKDQQPRR